MQNGQQDGSSSPVTKYTTPVADGPPAPTRRRGRSKGSKTSPKTGSGPAKEEYADKLPRIWLKDAWGEPPAHIARTEGVPLRDIKEILLHPEAEWVGLKETIRLGIVQQVHDKIWMLLQAVTPEKAKAASALQLVTSLGILIDKSRLMEGLPTSITTDVQVDIAKLMQPEVLKRLIQLKGGIQNLRPEHRALAESLGIENVIEVTVNAEAAPV